MQRDPYEVLGVSKGADVKAVKAAYRRLARDLHPDLHPGDTKAEDRFKEVAAAYDFLADSEQKARYDRGEIDASGAPKAQRSFYRTYAEGEPGTRYHDPREFFSDAGGVGGVFADLFGGRFGREVRSGPQRGADIRTRLDIDFVEAVKGGSREIVLPGSRRLKVTIPPGSTEGQVLRLKGQGQPAPSGGSPGSGSSGRGSPGDLHIELSVPPHPVLARQGNDIHADLPVTLSEAVLGARIDVPTVDGPVTLTVPKGSNTGTRLRLRGKGVPAASGGARGDQYVTLRVMLPQTPDEELSRFVEGWGTRHPYSVRKRWES